MRTILILSLVIILEHVAFAQIPKDPTTGKFTYVEIIEVKGDADKLYSILKEYITTHGSFQANLTSDQEQAKKITGRAILNTKSLLEVTGGGYTAVLWSYSLSAKDGKVRYIFEDFKYQMVNKGDKINERWFDHESASKGQVKRTHEVITPIIIEMKDFINKKISEDNDW